MDINQGSIITHVVAGSPGQINGIFARIFQQAGVRLQRVGQPVAFARVEFRGLGPRTLGSRGSSDVKVGAEAARCLADPDEQVPHAREVVGSLTAGACVFNVEASVIDAGGGASPLAVDVVLVGRLVLDRTGRDLCKADGASDVLAVQIGGAVGDNAAIHTIAHLFGSPEAFFDGGHRGEGRRLRLRGTGCRSVVDTVERGGGIRVQRHQRGCEVSLVNPGIRAYGSGIDIGLSDQRGAVWPKSIAGSIRAHSGRVIAAFIRGNGVVGHLIVFAVTEQTILVALSALDAGLDVRLAGRVEVGPRG